MAIDILVVDDEEDIRTALSHVLEDEGYEARCAKNSDEALQAVIDKRPNLVVLDVWLNNSNLDGIEILEELKRMYKDLPVVIISGHGTVDMAVTATKKGAYDFLSKPFKTDALLTTISRALETERLVLQNKALQDRAGAGDFSLIGKCKEIQYVRKAVKDFAGQNSAVLITGEIGTGKDVVAALLHEESTRTGLFQVFNAVNEGENAPEKLFGTTKPRRSGLLEDAGAGTTVIANVELLSKKVQGQLAQILGSGVITPIGSKKTISLTTRLVFISRDMKKLDDDLYARLKNRVIKMPNLSERISDIAEIAKSFMQYRSKAKGARALAFDTSAFVALSSHDWKGNMWELINVIDKILLTVTKGVVKAEDVNKILQGNGEKSHLSFDEIVMLDMRGARSGFEKYYLSYHLRRFDGNVTQTADFVGMDRAALSRKLKSLGLS